MVDQVLGVELERKIVWVEAQIWVAWGEICASRAPNDFSRPSETPNTPTHLPDEPFFSVPALIEKSRRLLKPSLKSLCATKRYLVLRGSESSIQQRYTLHASL